MCFVHKPMQNADFGQILCRRASTKRPRDLATDGPIFANLVSKDAQDLKEKKSWKGRVAICGGREAVADFVQGGVKLTPPQLR